MKNLSAASGFALISALFLMVVLSAMGAYLINMVAVQHLTPAMNVQSVRAGYAARSGMAWAVNQATATGACPATNSFTLSESSLAGFEIEVVCNRTLHEMPVGTRPYFVLDVSAHFGDYGSLDFVSRSLQAKVFGS